MEQACLSEEDCEVSINGFDEALNDLKPPVRAYVSPIKTRTPITIRIRVDIAISIALEFILI